MSDEVIIKEAPHVRRWVLRFLESNPLTTLDDIVQKQYVDKLGHRKNLYATSGFLSQAKKMLQEQKSKPIARGSISGEDFARMLAEHNQEYKNKICGVWITGKSICLDTGSRNYKYRIRLSEVNTLPKQLHWIDHLSTKTWMTTSMIRSFIELATTEEQLNQIRRGS